MPVDRVPKTGTLARSTGDRSSGPIGTRMGAMRWFSFGIAAILIASAASAVVAKTAGIPFGQFWPLILVSSAIYAIVGFLAARDAERVRMGTMMGVGLSLVDATAGVTVAGAINGDGFPIAGNGTELGSLYLSRDSLGRHRRIAWDSGRLGCPPMGQAAWTCLEGRSVPLTSAATARRRRVGSQRNEPEVHGGEAPGPVTAGGTMSPGGLSCDNEGWSPS
jgi:hypothetical protein